MEIHIQDLIPKTPRDRVKFVANGVVGMSVTRVVKDIVRQNFVPESRFQKAQLFVAAYAIGGMIAKNTEAFTHEKIDKAADFLARVKSDADMFERQMAAEHSTEQT